MILKNFLFSFKSDYSDPENEAFKYSFHCRELFYNICEHHVKDTLLQQKDKGLRAIYHSIVLEPSEFSEQLLNTLDNGESYNFY